MHLALQRRQLLLVNLIDGRIVREEPRAALGPPVFADQPRRKPLAMNSGAGV